MKQRNLHKNCHTVTVNKIIETTNCVHTRQNFTSVQFDATRCMQRDACVAGIELTCFYLERFRALCTRGASNNNTIFFNTKITLI